MQVAPPVWFHGENPRLPARYIVRLMRKHRVTIPALARRMNITQKRVREVRTEGVQGRCMCMDWHEAITGSGIFSRKDDMTTTAPPAEAAPMKVYSGYINLDGAFRQVDFQAPAGASTQERDACFVAALAQVAEINYVEIGSD